MIDQKFELHTWARMQQRSYERCIFLMMFGHFGHHTNQWVSTPKQLTLEVSPFECSWWSQHVKIVKKQLPFLWNNLQNRGDKYLLGFSPYFNKRTCPRNLHKECAHLKGGRDKHTHMCPFQAINHYQYSNVNQSSYTMYTNQYGLKLKWNRA